MKASLAGLMAMVQLTSAAYSREDYESGAVMESLKQSKLAQWNKMRAQGAYDTSALPPFPDVPVIRCENGKAVAEAGNPAQTFQCKNADLYDFKSHSELGTELGEGSSSWGWVSADGREFAAIGQFDGTAFAQITSEGKLVYLGRLPKTEAALGSYWREIRTFKDYLIVGSESNNHGVQVFNMNKLLTIDPASPVIFNPTTDVTALLKENLPIGRCHNVHANVEKNYVVAMGAVPRGVGCMGGLVFYDMSDMSNIKSPGCASVDGYVHDVECLVYRGPDTRYAGRDICYGYNEDTLTIYDVTDKSGLNASTIISRTSYPNFSYTHQGTVTNPNWQEFIILDDELDELDRPSPSIDGFATTIIMDIRDLENPKYTGSYKSSVQSIDHNQYVFGDYAYQSNYGAGLRVLDISSIPSDPTGAGVKEVAFFDVYPEDDEAPQADFTGTWSHYAGYPSGYILINSIERGAWVVKLRFSESPGTTATTTTTTTATSTSTTTTTTTTTTSSAPAPTCVPNAVVSGTNCIQGCGIARPGGDFRSVTTDSYEACAEACHNDAECIAAEYEKSTKRCSLKAVNNPLTRNIGIDSVICPKCMQGATISGTSCVQECGTDRAGGDYRHARVNSLASCARECSSDARCQTAQYVTSISTCYLKSVKNKIIPDSRVNGIVCR